MHDPNCLFCKIASGVIPSYKIYETENFLAFLDIFPHTEGYTLVIPKNHYRWVWDVENIGEYFEVCQKIVKHFQKVTGKDAVYTWILGEEIPHAHVRIIPDQAGQYISEVAKFMDEQRNTGKVSKLDNTKAKEIQIKFQLK
ncbi:MAG: HIT domain-containing protein [bacterium]